MAYATEYRADRAHKAELGFLQSLKLRFARQSLIRQTIRELNALSGAELADLGLHRSQITGVAIQAANERYGAL